MAKVTKASLDELHQDLANLNKHAERGSALTRKSIERFGARLAGVVDKHNRIIDGNDRQIAFGEADLNEIEIVEADPNKPVYLKFNDLDLADPSNPARELQVALHRSAIESFTIDAENLLASLNEGLKVDDWFRQDELDALLAGLVEKEPVQDAGAQVDKAQELLEKWKVKPGDMFALGSHRLICGDCTDKATVERLMGGEKAHATITDPPYGTASGSKVQKRGDKIETFDIEWDKEAPVDWIPFMFEYLEDGAAVVSFWDNKDITRLWNSLKDNGFNTLQTVYWKKTTVPQPRPNFCSSIESSVFARKPGKVLCWNGGGATPNVFDANRAAGNERVAHETQKPLSLFSWLIELVTEQEFIVYEPFSGSGTTIIACEQLNRQCRAVEISPAYVSVALQRYFDSTGIEPVLIES